MGSITHHDRLCFTAAGIIAATFAVSGAAADPVVVYGSPPVPIVVPPTGYVLDPSDAVKPIYVVNQGPVYSGLGIYTIPTYAFPTYSEGGYAYAAPYPYVKSYGAWYPPGGSFYRRDSYGRYGSAGPMAKPLGYRPYGYYPYVAYRYLPAPNARVIEVPPQETRLIETPSKDN